MVEAALLRTWALCWMWVSMGWMMGKKMRVRLPLRLLILNLHHLNLKFQWLVGAGGLGEAEKQQEEVALVDKITAMVLQLEHVGGGEWLRNIM
jgi:hypothetical protein